MHFEPCFIIFLFLSFFSSTLGLPADTSLDRLLARHAMLDPLAYRDSALYRRDESDAVEIGSTSVTQVSVSSPQRGGVARFKAALAHSRARVRH